MKYRNPSPKATSFRILKYSIVILLVLISFWPKTLKADDTSFSDLPQEALYKSYLLKFQKQNIIIGDTAGGQPIGRLRPNDFVQRDEFSKVAVLMRLLEDANQKGQIKNYQNLSLKDFTLKIADLLKPYYKPTKGAKNFLDVKQKDDSCASNPQGCQPWHTEYINYASSHGMIKGYPDGTFKPGNAILRIHSLKLILADDGNLTASQDAKFQKLSSDPRIQKVHKPKCLEGAEGYILANNGGDNKDSKNLLAYAILADKLDFFGSGCEFFSQNGANSPQERAGLLQKPLTRKEIARYFSIATFVPSLKADHSNDSTTATAAENGMNFYDPTYQPDLSVASQVNDDPPVYGPVPPPDLQSNQTSPYDLEGKTGRCCQDLSTSSCKVIDLTSLTHIDTDSATYVGAEVWLSVKNGTQSCYMPYSDVIDGFGQAANQNEGLIPQSSLDALTDFAKKWEATFPEEYFAYTGIVKLDDNLNSVTTRLNKYYGTNYTPNQIAQINGFDPSEAVHTVGPIRIGTLDGWQPPEDDELIDKNYWFDLSLEQQKILHFHRNAYQIGKIPEHESELKEEEWKQVAEEAPAHNVGTSGNSDYRGLRWREGQQAIYDKNGNLVTSAENMGTFDFEVPQFTNNLYLNHLEPDVRPWIEWGNSPQDSTSKNERICSMSKDTIGRWSLDILDYSYDNC